MAAVTRLSLSAMIRGALAAFSPKPPIVSSNITTGGTDTWNYSNPDDDGWAGLSSFTDSWEYADPDAETWNG